MACNAARTCLQLLYGGLHSPQISGASLQRLEPMLELREAKYGKVVMSADWPCSGPAESSEIETFVWCRRRDEWSTGDGAQMWPPAM